MLIKLRAYLFTAGLILSFLASVGQETVVLKNGSRLFGHRSVDDVSAKILIFTVDSASIIMPFSEVIAAKPELRKVDNLNSKWKEWIGVHPEKVVKQKRDKKANVKSVWMGEIIAKKNDGDFFGDAIIQELTDTSVRFFTTNNGEMSISKNRELEKIIFAPREPLALVGVIDEIETVSGDKITGQIVEDCNKSMVLLTDDGIRHIIPFAKIRAKRILPFNTHYPLADQLRYLTRITLKENGELQTIVGVITETVYKPKGDEKNGYYTIIDIDGTNSRKYPFSAIQRISYFSNPNYIKEKDVQMDEGDFLIQGHPAKASKYDVKADRFEVTDTTQIIRVKTSELQDGMLRIHYVSTDPAPEFIFVEADKSLSPDSAKESKSKDKRDAIVTYYALTNDMLMAGFPPREKSISPSGIESVKFGPLSAGKAYMLIRKFDPAKSAYIILIED